MRKLYLLLFGISLLSIEVSGQKANEANIMKVEKLDFIKNLYRSFIGEYSPVYTGLQYVNYNNNMIGHQFFFSDEPTNSTLIYDGIRYDDFPLMYDIRMDELVVIHDSTDFHSVLVKEKVEAFQIFDYYFINLSEAPDSKNDKGIYNLVYNGDLKVWIKRKKFINRYIKAESYIQEFAIADIFLVEVNDVYHTISNKGSLLSLFGKKKREVKRYLKDQKASFRKDKETTIVTAVSYFDTL